jgi:hypothetical protein
MITHTNKYGAILVTTEPADLAGPAGPPNAAPPDHDHGTTTAAGLFLDDQETEDFINTVAGIRERKRRMALEEQRRRRRERGLPELPPEEE